MNMPTKQEIGDWHKECAVDARRPESSIGSWPFEVSCDDLAEIVVAALSRWGRPAAPPAPEPGVVGELVDRLGWIAAQLFDIGWSDDSASVARAATLLQQLSAPALMVVPAGSLHVVDLPPGRIEPLSAPAPVEVPVPVAVAERLPGEGDLDAEGRLWIFMPDIGSPPSWRLVDPRDIRPYHTHWSPAHAIPVPQAGEGEV
jgi:hypothetical protein